MLQQHTSAAIDCSAWLATTAHARPKRIDLTSCGLRSDTLYPLWLQAASSCAHELHAAGLWATMGSDDEASASQAHTQLLPSCHPMRPDSCPVRAGLGSIAARPQADSHHESLPSAEQRCHDVANVMAAASKLEAALQSPEWLVWLIRAFARPWGCYLDLGWPG